MSVCVDSLMFFFSFSKGDYLRYLAEYAVGEKQKEYSEASTEALQQSHAVMKQSLPPTNPIRLGLALSYASFSYEILGKADEACQVTPTISSFLRNTNNVFW